MEIKLKLNKDVNSNAEIYFSKSKKLKNKLPGIDKIIIKTKKEIEDFEKRKTNYLEKKTKKEQINIYKKKEWYDKFRHTITSNNLLCVFGKDAQTNEILIKKHMEENDIVLHTEEPKSPFCLIKNGLNKAIKEDIEEAAQFLACFSAQWKKGFGTADVFWVTPEQVSSKAISGEYMSKGSFMIYGKKNILKNIQLQICLGIEKKTITTTNEENNKEETIKYEEIFSGSLNAVKKICNNKFVKLEPGKDTYKALTKLIKKKMKISYLEDLPKYIPNNCKVMKK